MRSPSSTTASPKDSKPQILSSRARCLRIYDSHFSLFCTKPISLLAGDLAEGDPSALPGPIFQSVIAQNPEQVVKRLQKMMPLLRGQFCSESGPARWARRTQVKIGF